ncbi:sodium:solute symporter family protein [candidate division KSB1 bacterium]|nr:sodium:solute symporter family protein [candidate division KSB1 bacterium]
MLGLHFLDLLTILVYFAAIVLIGYIANKRIKDEEDFFLGGRKFGKLVSIFLAFGAGTSSDTAITASRETYRAGMSGIWVQLLWLFVTPFYWILAPWYRRLRVLTGGDYFDERFDSSWLTNLYVFFGLLWFMFYIAIGFTAIGKTVEIVTVKPESEYTQIEKHKAGLYQEYKSLLERQQVLDSDERQRLNELSGQVRHGEIKAFYSYITSSASIPVIALIVIIYGVLGGLFAAAWTDTLQGMLIIVLSVLLLPTGLSEIGWFSGLHAKTPDYMFNIIGSAATSEYTWHYIIALIVMNLVGVAAQPHIFAIGGGGAKDELSARIGLVFGNFLKRFVTILWAFTGVLAFALYGKVVGDPDMIWGYATSQLLGPGFVGLMIACLLAAAMSSADAFMISGSALFTKNLYRPLRPHKPEKHYVATGRLVSVGMILGAIALALYFNNVLSLIKYIWQLPIIFGSVFWLSILWRRVSKSAALTAVIYSGLMIIILPALLPQIGAISGNESLLIYTEKQMVTVRAGATEQDVELGLAEEVGDVITKEHPLPSVPVLFETIIEKESPEGIQLRGEGKINPNLLILHLLGADLRSLSHSGLMTLSYAIDIIMPFLLMIIISLLTTPVSATRLDRFYAKFQTPVQKDPETDREQVNESIQNPKRYRAKKLFPHSSWEIMKPTPIVLWGFIACFAIAVAVMGFAFLVVNIQWP